MKTYCVKQRKQTECVPGSETYVRTKNGRSMMKCKCAECRITKLKKTKFVKGTAGKGLILGKHSPFNKIPILGAILKELILYVNLYCVKQKKQTACVPGSETFVVTI